MGKRSGKAKRRRERRARRARRTLALLLFCALVMLASLGYMFHYERTRQRILRGNAEYSALYSVPSLTPTEAVAPEPTATLAPEPTAPVTQTPDPTTLAPSEEANSPTAKIEITSTPGLTPTLASDFEIAMDQTRAPLATADADTLVIAMQTPPPVQESFNELLASNPETVGFLSIEDVLSLPVVQRPNDNDFYLSHSFDLEESIGGTLFLDGANLLVPEDDCLIVYGHNMRNGTMFRPLVEYEEIDFLKENALIRFDTLYENRVYAPFAALTVTVDPDSERYLNLRQFSFDQAGFDLFVRSLRTLSVWENPIDVEYGDRILLLVTCEYTHDNGRFVLALRAQRGNEAWDQLWNQVQQTEAK